MSFTYDVTTDAGKVRLITTDTDQDNAIFEDDEIDSFLALKGGSILLAAATALDTIASSEALITKKIQVLDVQTDGPAVARSLRDHAKSLRDQFNQDDIVGAFDIAEVVYDVYTEREYWLHLAYRGLL